MLRLGLDLDMDQLIDPMEDRSVAYTLDVADARKRRVAGDSMTRASEPKRDIV